MLSGGVELTEARTAIRPPDPVGAPRRGRAALATPGPARSGGAARRASAAVAVALSALVGAAPGAASARPGQVITVEAARASSQVAVVRAWRLGSDGRYREVLHPIVANVGVNGVGPTREGRGRTPVGVFTLTRAFGNRPNPGTRLPYRLVGPDDWWDEDPASPEYNHLVVRATSPGGDSENLYDAGPPYAHAVVINYNTDPVVPGAGSGFFLHVTFHAPTEGCVAVPAGDLDWLMRWLNPSRHPVISIAVGAAALAPVRG